MSEATIRAAIKSTLEGVSNIGPVHDRMRWTRSLAELLKMLEDDDGTVNGWMIHRASASATRYPNGRVDREHQYRILGIYKLDDDDDTDSDFQALLEAIHDAFISDGTLGGACTWSDAIQITDIDTEEYGNRLYHVAELTLAAQERITS